MKKMRLFLVLLFAGSILSTGLFGQSTQTDSLKKYLYLSDEVVKKLDSKDIVEIIKYKEKLRQEKEMAGNPYAKEVKNLKPGNLSITVWTILTFTFILALIVIPFYFNLNKAKGRQQIIKSLIEKDKEIPKELISASTNTGRSDFHKGVILISLGFSLSLFLKFMGMGMGNHFWTIGMIPMFIGIGYLISYKFDSSNKIKSEIE